MPLLILGILTGVITPAQTAINARLRKAIGTPFRASLVSFTVGLTATTLAALVLGPYPLVPASALRGPWWMWFAGLFGVIFMTGNILLLPKLGSLQTVLMPVLGQILMGLLIDQFGWFGSARHPMTAMRAGGLILAVIGVLAAIVAANTTVIRATSGASPDHTAAGVTIWLWRGLGVACGMSSAVQTALLGRLGTALGSPIKASVVSFAVGFLALLLVVLLHDRGFGLKSAAHGGNPRWMWCGGLLGATVVLSTSWLSPQLGTGLTVLLVLIGQVTGGLLVDRFGWFGAARRRITALQIVGVAVAIAGITLIRLS